MIIKPGPVDRFTINEMTLQLDHEWTGSITKLSCDQVPCLRSQHFVPSRQQLAKVRIRWKNDKWSANPKRTHCSGSCAWWIWRQSQNINCSFYLKVLRLLHEQCVVNDTKSGKFNIGSDCSPNLNCISTNTIAEAKQPPCPPHMFPSLLFLFSKRTLKYRSFDDDEIKSIQRNNYAS
jgi:hypothetical protein